MHASSHEETADEVNHPIEMDLFRHVKDKFDRGEPLDKLERGWAHRHVTFFQVKSDMSDAQLVARLEKRIAEKVTKRLLAGTLDR